MFLFLLRPTKIIVEEQKISNTTMGGDGPSTNERFQKISVSSKVETGTLGQRKPWPIIVDMEWQKLRRDPLICKL